MKLTQVAHEKIIDLKGENFGTSVDATLGNGHDAIFLAKHSKKLFGFDIQQQAIDSTKQKIKTSAHSCQVYLIKDGHQNLDQHIHEPIDVAMFNLGYLPGADHQTTTQSHTTLTALNKTHTLLAPQGLLSILCYPGHPAGKIETEEVRQHLVQKKCKIFFHQTVPNNPQGPVLFVIQK